MDNLIEMRNDIGPEKERATAKFLDDMTSNFGEVFGIYEIDGMDSWQALHSLYRAGGELNQKGMLVEKMSNTNSSDSKKRRAIDSLEKQGLVKMELNNEYKKGSHKILLTDKGNKAILTFHRNVRLIIAKYQEAILK